MKKLILIMIVAMVAPLMAAEATVGGTLQSFYFMDMVQGDQVANSQFGIITTKLWTAVDFGDNVTGKLKLAVYEASNGAFNSVDAAVEEVWIAKQDAFDVAGLGFKLGRMEVPFNLDVDNGITHSFTNTAVIDIAGDIYVAPGELDNIYGLNVSYMVEGVGTFNLTSFEGQGGLDQSEPAPEDYEDEDTGLFNSMALNWDTGADAFGVTGLRLVVGYAMIKMDDDADDATVLSLGATYEAMEGLVIGLEIMPLISNINSEDGSMVYALDVDYKIDDTWAVGLTYEALSIKTNDITGVDEEDTSANRLAVRGSMAVTEGVKLQMEYMSFSVKDDDYTDAQLDAAANGDANSSIASGLRIGVIGTF